MQTKFIYIEDDTAVLFAANGAPLLALIGAFADIVPLQKFSMPALAMWLYLFGLFFIFLSKIIIQAFNDDMRQRERLQNGRDILLENMARPDLPAEFLTQMEDGWKQLESFTAKLIDQKTTTSLAKWRAFFFLLSGICFIVASLSLVLAAGSALKH